jgi:hypothetical protein
VSTSQAVRKSLSVRERSRRALLERLALSVPWYFSFCSRLLFRLPPTSRIRQALVWRGHQVAYEAFNRRDFEAFVITFIDAGECVVALVRTTGRGAATGASFGVEGAILNGFEGGRIVEMREFADRPRYKRKPIRASASPPSSRREPRRRRLQTPKEAPNPRAPEASSEAERHRR